MLDNKYVYALYHEPSKSFVVSGGYYGNETNIRAFASKGDGQRHIEAYYKGQGYKLKIMTVKS